MVIVGKCCFVIPLKQATVLVGLISMTVSFVGLILSVSSILHYLKMPEDPLLMWLLQIYFFVDVHGIVFHAILFIVSFILTCGAVKGIYPLLVPWLGWCPFLITGILVQMSMALIKKSDLALPLILFCLMNIVFIVYGAMVVTAYHRDARSAPARLRIFDLGEGELPRIVQVPSRYFPRRGHTGRGLHIATFSTQPLQRASESSAGVGTGSSMQRWPKLASAYARFIAVTTVTNPRTDAETQNRF